MPLPLTTVSLPKTRWVLLFMRWHTIFYFSTSRVDTVELRKNTTTEALEILSNGNPVWPFLDTGRWLRGPLCVRDMPMSEVQSARLSQSSRKLHSEY